MNSLQIPESRSSLLLPRDTEAQFRRNALDKNGPLGVDEHIPGRWLAELAVRNGAHDMPLNKYGVLKARIRSYARPPWFDQKPHVEFVVDVGQGQDQTWKIAVNCQAIQAGMGDLLFLESLHRPPAIAAQNLATRQLGFNSGPGWTLDYRSDLDLSADALPTAPMLTVIERLEALAQESVNDPDAKLYVFGDKFLDGKGLHNIHMNQGGYYPWNAENGRNQDGALVFQIPRLGQVNEWTSIYMAFQAQTWDTNGQGNPAPGAVQPVYEIKTPPSVAGVGLRYYWDKSVAELREANPPPVALMIPEQHYELELHMLLVMSIVESYWNGNKFGPRGTYHDRANQVDPNLPPLATTGLSYKGYLGSGREGRKTDLNNVAETYLGHNIAALAVDDHGIPIDFEFNCTEVFDSSVEHAEARLVKRLIGLAQNWVNRPWTRNQDDNNPRSKRKSNLRNIRIYTTVEPCAQCAGIMALAEIREVVYIQPDPLFHGISDIFYNLTHPPMPGGDKQPVRAPRPCPGSFFWSGTNYSDKLTTAFETYQQTIQQNPGTRFFKSPDRQFTPEDPGITAFLCTDTAYNIFRAARLELDRKVAWTTPQGASGPVFVQDPNVNVAIRKNAKEFLDYVESSGGRGLKH